MASLQDAIDIIIRAEDQASTTIRSVIDAMDGLDSKAQSVAAPLASMADAVLLAEGAVLGLGVALAGIAINEAVQFQDSLYDVEKQLGDSGVTMEQARKDIEAIGLTYGINANEVAASVAGFQAAGHDYETASRLVVTATQLMIAGQLDGQFATDALNKSLAGFKVPAEDAADAATHVGDVLNKIGDISSGTFEEIVRGFTDIAPTAKDAGLSIEQTAAYTAVLVDVFGSGSEAATSLKSGLLSLLTPSKDAESALKNLGISLTDSNGELKSANSILTELAGKWGELTDAQKLQTAAIIFGKEQAGAMNVVLGDWGKAQSYVTQMLDETTGAVGSMAKEVEGKLELISSKINSTEEAWRQFVEHLGARILTGESLGEATESVGALGTALKEVVDSGAFDDLIDWLQDSFSEISTFLSGIAKNLPEAFDGVDWSGLIDTLDGLKEAAGEIFQNLLGDIDLTSVEGLQQAIQLVVDSIGSLTNATTGIVEAFQPVAAVIGETVKQFNALDTESQIDFGETIGSAKLLVEVGTGLGLALIAIGKSGVEMSQALDVAFGASKIAVNALQTAFDAAVLAVLEGTQELLYAVGFEEKADDLQIYIDAVRENALRNAQELKDGWAQAMGEAGKATQEASERLDAAATALKNTGAASSEAGKSLKGMAGDAKASADNLLTADEIIAQLPESLRALAGASKDAGEGVKSVVDPLENAAKAAEHAEAAKKGYTLAIVDGIKTYTQYGTALSGAKDAVDTVSKSMDDNAKKAKEAAEEAAKYAIEMEKIASNERIKMMEFVSDMHVAEVEADAKRVSAAFEGIGVTVQSTGELIGSLVESLLKADSFGEKWLIEDLIKEENLRRQQALDLQKQLIQAELKRIEAQTNLLQKGDAVIKIEADGLEPEIEAFMWKILGKIQTRANATFADYLLGVEVAT